ncbi:MAG TPA: YbhB/YbcL family Raf kinase inhibitor-like protein [Caulobacter sp.]|nr:YbhB/YbcL family Raf kinase inhibitor-like protein [Caulobacter sp.]
MPEHSGESITILRVDAREDFPLAPISEAQGADGRLADRHTALADNVSPPLRWNPVPEAKSYALVVEDPDAPRDLPFVHWMMWDIPGDTTALPEGLPNDAVVPNGAVQGRNDMGAHGWFGPRPPAGHGTHRYYFQLFALDKMLGMDPETPLEELVNALKRDTIAKGEMVATYEAPAEDGV